MHANVWALSPDPQPDVAELSLESHQEALFAKQFQPRTSWLMLEQQRSLPTGIRLVRDAPEQIVICVICWFLWMQHTPSLFHHPQSKGTNTSFFWKQQNHFRFQPLPLFSLFPRPSSPANPKLWKFHSSRKAVPDVLYAGKQPQPSCCSSMASPGLLCFLGPKF